MPPIRKKDDRPPQTLNIHWLEQAAVNAEKVKQAIDSAYGPWKKGEPARGVIDCPVCGGEKCLSFSRDARSGHVHAACRTGKCIAFME